MDFKIRIAGFSVVVLLAASSALPAFSEVVPMSDSLAAPAPSSIEVDENGDLPAPAGYEQVEETSDGPSDAPAAMHPEDEAEQEAQRPSPTAKIKDPVQAQAVMLLGKKRYSEACHLLDTNYPIETDDKAVLFLRARCRMGMKHYEAAYHMYKRLSVLSPESARIKNELAAVEKLVAPRPAPQQVVRTARAKSAPAKESRIWFARLEAALLYDTNVNSGPQSSEIIISGSPVILGGGSAPIDTAGHNISGLWGYLHSIGGTNFLLTKVTVDHTDYFHPGDFAFDSYSFSVGPIYSFGDTRVSLAPGATWQSYAGDAYSKSLDFAGRVTQKINDTVTIAARFTGAMNDYLTLEGRDGLTWNLSPSIEIKPSKDTLATFTATGRVDNTESSTYSSDTLGYRINLEHSFTNKVKGSVAYQNNRRSFEGPEIAFSPSPRTDKLNTKTFNLSWDISDLASEGVSLNFRYQYVANKSDSPIYSYSRETSTLSIAKSW